VISLKQSHIGSDAPAMSFERPSSALQYAIRSAWVLFVAFLALAAPAHALLPSETAAVLFQLVGAALASVLFAVRGPLVRQTRRTATALAEWTREREVGSAPGVEGAEQLGSHS